MKTARRGQFLFLVKKFMCGIVGIYRKEKNCALDVYESLVMLQHRGQDAAGLVTFDGRYFHETKGEGLARDVLTEDVLRNSPGTMGIGHVRYPTAGAHSAKEAQPFFVHQPFGIYLVHNGNLTNTDALRERVGQRYFTHLRTDSDSEMLLAVLARRLYNTTSKLPSDQKKEMLFQAVCETMDRISGAYSVIAMVDKVGLLAFRDPHGIRPLVIGTNSAGEYCFASEDVAFGPIGFTPLRDVKPGEAILIDTAGEMHTMQCQESEHRPCLFEYIYLARPDSTLDDISVYKTRLRMGKKLAEQIKRADLAIDSVMCVPTSSRPVAMELAQTLGISYREGLVKSRYVGRTFIMPTQEDRELSVRRKLGVVPLEFKDKNILLVDDSIVRGTTMRKTVQLCRDAGARAVYVASGSPPVRFQNIYGVDLPTKEELVAHNREIEEIRKEIGADALFYQTLEDMCSACSEGNSDITKFEDSCFTGNYL